MSSLKLVISTVGIVLLLTRCDPAKLIILKNKTDEPAYFRWTIKADTLGRPSTSGEYETLTSRLGVNKNDRKNTMYFGFGGWSKRGIERFVRDYIQSVEIETSENRIILTDKAEIKDFLLKRRHGLFNNFITIRIKNDVK